ncbi:MAG: methyltransferase domain-containing protein [Gemmatimonadetes bacterium]|nr:methyltransferase domain-containing protein [Gemmatimonadota bacterium]
MTPPVTQPPSLVRVAIVPSAAVSRQAVIEAMFAGGAEALEEQGDMLVTALDGPRAAEVVKSVHLADAAANVETTDAPTVDWATAWRAQIRAHTVGLLTVSPPWLAAPFLPERTVVIEPAMAFGTGDHATTRGVLLLMQDVVRADDRVADLGAGSAVLAIAAAKLGAARVAAIELDPDAIGNAEDNVIANGVADRVTVIEGDAATLLPLVAPVRVVFANIVSLAIRDLLDVIASSLAPDGVAIFSGMLASERDAMRAYFESSGWILGREVIEGEWWTIAATRRA